MAVPEAVNGVSVLSGIPIVVDPEVALELESSGVVLNVSTLTDISVESLLNIITQQAGEDLTWTVKHGVAMVTRKDKALGAGLPRIHSVQDLTFALTDFGGPKIGRIPLPGEEVDEESGGPYGSDQVGENVVQPEEIVNLIRENIARDTWDTGGFSIDTANNNQILVIHTPEVQMQVAQFLDDLRRFASSVVTIESRFVAITEGFLQEVGVDWRGLGGSGQGTEAFLNDVTYGLEDNAGSALDNSGPGLPTGAGLSPVAGAFFNDNSDGDIRAFSENMFNTDLGNVLSTTGGGAMEIFFVNGDSEYNMVINAVEKSLFATVVSTPILTVYNTERAYFTVTNQVSFVQDFDVDVANSAFIANPNIGIIQEGVVLDVRPTISYDRKYITLEIQATVAELQQPIREFTTSLAGFSIPVTFQLPELQVQAANTTVRVPDRGSLILGGLKRLNYVNRTAEIPWLGRIPILGILFREKGLDDEAENLIIIVRATITNLSELRETL
jgi:general secretion pathway protein D